MIVPINNLVLVEILLEEQKTTSGIIISNDKQSPTTKKGIIISVGNLVEEVEIGQVVIMEQFEGTPINKDGKKYVIVEECNILAVLE
jgi:chaperonin GroES